MTNNDPLSRAIAGRETENPTAVRERLERHLEERYPDPDQPHTPIAMTRGELARITRDAYRAGWNARESR